MVPTVEMNTHFFAIKKEIKKPAILDYYFL